MPHITPFLWFDGNAEDAANFYLSVFPHARKVGEMRSKGVGPWPLGSIATITIELEGQEVTFLNGGPGHPHTDAFSFVLRCESQEEIDRYWEKLLEGGGSEIACGWLKDRFGVCWQVVPKDIFNVLQHPRAMEAMMSMKKLDMRRLEAAARED